MTGINALLLTLSGTAAIWAGLAFINGTLLVGTLAYIYETIASPWLRMLVILPVVGIGHLLFSLGLKLNPAVASPAGIVFTIAAPTLYALWLIRSYPNARIAVYAVFIIAFALLLGFELNKLR